MKRLIFCFDGTWNRLDAKNVTNVVHTARNVAYQDDDGISQIVHYDEGLGTKAHERLRGGLFGMGLMDNVEEAYRFLTFNYEQGDEIYLFGFSRGAFSARSFAGLIYNCGIVNDVRKIPEAISLYQDRVHDDRHMDIKFRDFRLECSPHLCVDQTEFNWRVSERKCNFVPLKTELKELSKITVPDLSILNIKYVGVWDTVGALGVPKSISIASFVNRKHQFHDCDLSTFVSSARHAVAIDEKRRSFEPTLWTNVDDMNEIVKYDPTDEDAPYKQQWFPGVHGSVGGGGDYSGLSDEALEWVWAGAKRLGLKFSTTRSQSIYDIKPDFKDHLVNQKSAPWYKVKSHLTKVLPRQPRSIVKDKKANPPTRDIRPRALHEVSVSTRMRWQADGATLKPIGKYRPDKTLDHVKKMLDNLHEDSPLKKVTKVGKKAKIESLEIKSANLTHVVVRGDSLSKVAKLYYNDESKYELIFAANAHMLTHVDRIYPGQVLVIPQLA